MSRDDAIQVEGTVVEVLREQLLCVELANGHRLLAHIPGCLRQRMLPFAPGDRARVEMSPFDLNKGRVIERLNELKHESPCISKTTV